ncbi:hypothetical protein [Streptomyces sp. BP-8]|uniref:Secreted protein n=1 Tax=Streptomyces sirii TaxID=3127701 RepID=A0ABZ2QG70_9ACTN
MALAFLAVALRIPPVGLFREAGIGARLVADRLARCHRLPHHGDLLLVVRTPLVHTPEPGAAVTLPRHPSRRLPASACVDHRGVRTVGLWALWAL